MPAPMWLLATPTRGGWKRSNPWRLGGGLIAALLVVQCKSFTRPAPGADSAPEPSPAPQVALQERVAGCKLVAAKKPPINLAGEREPAYVRQGLAQLVRRIPGVKVEVRTVSPAGYADVGFTHLGLPLCRHDAKIYPVAGRVTVRGRLPPAGISFREDGDWTPGGQLGIASAQRLGLRSFRVVKREACWDAPPGQPLGPAWKLYLEENGRTYYGLEDRAGAVLEWGPYNFAATGHGTIWADVPGGELRQVSLGAMQDDGYLCSDWFITHPPGGGIPIHEPKRQFRFAPADPRFEAVTMFAHAQEMVRWLDSTLGARDWFGQQIELVLAEDGQQPVYVPPWNSTSGRPVILLPKAWNGLVHLRTEADVIRHELAHHFIYKTLKEIHHPPTFVIHEGMADYLVMALTGRDCLAPSVCTKSFRCARQGQCLRAVQDGRIDDEKWADDHERAQVLAGLLWRLGEGAGHEAIARLVYRSIDFLLARAEYRDWVIALAHADEELASGNRICRLHALAKERGLIAEATCDAFRAAL